MPKAARKSNHVDNTSENELQEDSNLSQDSCSGDEVVLQSPQFQPSTSQMQAMQQMYMPYIEGPKMDWTVSNSLYHRFLKLNVRIYWIVNWQCYQKQENARKLWPGQVILELTSMYPGACSQKIYAWK